MESKLYPRTKNLLSFLSHNNLIDDSTSQEILNTLDTIKNTNDKDDEYVDIYKVFYGIYYRMERKIISMKSNSMK